MDLFEILTTRGFVEQTTHEGAVHDLLTGEPVTFYTGFDPTGPSLHAGHLLPIMLMSWLQRAGHRPIALLGGGTAKVGDPSGKDETRPLLDDATIAANSAGLRGQLERFLTLDGEAGLLLDNADWIETLSYIGFLRDIGRLFSVNRMLSAEAYRARLERGLSFIEFNYQLLQAYDFLTLFRDHRCTLQVGGNDQWGNILAGVDLIRRLHATEVHALTIPLLTTATGAKMGKTAGGAVWLDAGRTSPFDYFQYWYNCDDRDVGRLLRLYTFLPLDEIEALEALQGADIRRAKRILARECTRLAHGDAASQQADDAARAMVSASATADLPTHVLTGDELATGPAIYAVLADAGLLRSRGEGRRMLKQGAVKLNGKRVDDVERALSADDLQGGALVLRVGKKKVLRVVVEG